MAEVEKFQRFKAIVQYDGTNYAGFQIQPQLKTIQGELEKALATMSKASRIPVVGAGRTDAGVHANGQVIHFDYPRTVQTEALFRGLNSLLPKDIRIVKVEKVPSYFHARFMTKGKRYRYFVSLAPFASAFEHRYVLSHPYPTDLKRIEEALKPLIGKHNFKSFSSTKTEKKDFVRTLHRAEIKALENHKVEFIFEGDGFLYNMVRILVGTSLQIGDGLRPVEEMSRLLEAQDRNEAGPTALAQGLFLDEVFYMNDEEQKVKALAHQHYLQTHFSQSDQE